MIKILINNINSKIVGYLPEKVHKELNEALSYKMKNARFLLSVKRKKWDGVYRLYKQSGQTFYSGLLSLAEEVLKANDIAFQRIDERIKPKQNLPQLKFTPTPFFEERDYQKITIERSVKATRGILKIATGGGKTMIVAQMIAEIKTYPFMFYVLTEDLMHQAYDTLTATLNEPIGRIGGGYFDIQKINVCTIQTAVIALNIENKAFDISEYRFDEEDVWDKDQIESVENLIKLREVIMQARGLYMDECIDGDTEVLTEKGKVKIKEIKRKKCRFVQTYDGNNIVFKPILNWWNKGMKKTLKIKTESGEEIICTKNHMFYTKEGWMKAEDLNTESELLLASVDAEQNLLKENIEKESLFLDTKFKEEQKKNGKKYTTSILRNFRNVCVDVENKYCQDTKPSKRLLGTKVREEDAQNTLLGTTSNRYGENIILNQRSKKNRLLSEHAWETLLLRYQTKDLKTLGYPQHTDIFKKSGQNIKLFSCKDTEQKQVQQKVVGTETYQLEHVPHVCQPLRIFQKTFIKAEKRKLPLNYSTKSEILGLLGGYAMTEAEVEKPYVFTRRDGEKKKTTLYETGLTLMDYSAQQEKVKENIFTFFSKQMLLSNFQKEYPSLFQNVCDTSWSKIREITENEEKNVYDIEVKDTHCFFANGILVHNCHHTSATTCKEVLTASPFAYWRFGGSATPYREDGAEIVIQAMFGKKIVDISASYLIDRDYLVKPYIIFDPIKHDCALHSYQAIYKNCIAQNDEFNSRVVKIAKYIMSKNLKVLILVQQYCQGNFLQKQMPELEFTTGKTNRKIRKEALNRVKSGEKNGIIGTSLYDEGIDAPALDAVIMAGGGASSTRVFQRIGRALRKNKENKNKALVIYFSHNAKHLEKHAKKAKRIMQLEPRFEIIESSGDDFLFYDINEVLGCGNSILNI